MKTLRILTLALLLLWSVVYGLSTTYAAVPHLINYQGRLTDKSGSPLNGSYALTFRIYDAENAGNLLWQGTYNNVGVTKGMFNILLGDVNDSGYNFETLAFDNPYWLEIKVGEDIMSPRQRITSAGYAIRADQAEDANTIGHIGVSTAPAANKLLPLDSNAKLPQSAVALKVYDSGWFAVETNNNYTRNHNLGTTRVIYQLWFSPNSNGSPCYSIYGIVELDQDGRGNYRGGFVTELTPSSITVSTSGCSGNGNYVWDGLTSSSHATGYRLGYYRIIVLALE